MALRRASNGEIGLPILIVSVLVLAGMLVTLIVGGGLAWPLGALTGFLVGIAVVSTVEYASKRIRRT